MEIRQQTNYCAHRYSSDTGVTLSLKFGHRPSKGILWINPLDINGSLKEIKFDIEQYMAEIMEGIEKANKEFHKILHLQEVTINPDDNPRTGQAQYVAYKIACFVHEEEL